MKTLIVGMGFGKAVYGSIYERLGWDIVYVDPYNKDADYIEIPEDQSFATAHICTPNTTHYDLANAAAKVSDIVFVEKPGVKNVDQWNKLCTYNPTTRFMMTKNNQHRWSDAEIEELKQRASSAENIKICWVNNNRVPRPGSWFTNKKLAYGGVSRDLTPHLLSIYQLLYPTWKHSVRTQTSLKQNWTLDDLTDSDYGDVIENGVYDVDDYCLLTYQNFEIYSNWRSKTTDDFAIYFDDERIELGPLCPESAYENMINAAIDNWKNDNFWKHQKEMDLWIHRHVATL